MTKTLLKITIICAACAMLSVALRAQSAPLSSNDSSGQTKSGQSWSTKRLTATGRTDDSPVRGSELVGARVNDISGDRAGEIRDILVNPGSGRIDFALLSLSGMPTNAGGSLVPVPWKLLRPSTAQYSEAASQRVFTLNIDQSKLKGAPTVSTADLDQSQWRQRVFAYYGVTPPPPAAGGTESEQEETKGHGARSLQSPNPESQSPTNP